MKTPYDNGVGIVIGDSGDIVGSRGEPEGSFAKPLLRLGLARSTSFFSLAVFLSSSL